MDLRKFIDEMEQRLADGEEEIYVMVDNTLYDFDIQHQDEAFDGFYTSFPACCALVPKEENND